MDKTKEQEVNKLDIKGYRDKCFRVLLRPAQSTLFPNEILCKSTFVERQAIGIWSLILVCFFFLLFNNQPTTAGNESNKFRQSNVKYTLMKSVVNVPGARIFLVFVLE